MTLSGGALLNASLKEFGHSGSSLGAVSEPILEAFDEVFSLDAYVVINTCDIRLELRTTTPEAATR